MKQQLRLAALLFGSLLPACAADSDVSRVPVEPPPFEEPVAVPAVPESPLYVPGSGPQSSCIEAPTGMVTYGTSGIDGFRDVAVNAQGTILAAGFDRGQTSFYGMVQSRGVALAYRNAFTEIAKLDTAGTDSFESLAIDPSTREIYLAARTNDDLPGLPVVGNYDFVIGKLASGFQPLTRGWDTTPEQPRSLSISNGFVALAGHETRVMADGSTRLNPFLATYRTGDTLAPQWFMTRSRPDLEVFTSVDVGSERVVTGGENSSDDAPGTFVTLWSQDADVLWRHPISSQAFDRLATVRMLADGNVLWAGTTRAQLGDAAFGGTDLVVGVLDGATGEPVWTSQLGTDGEESIADIALDASGRIYVAANVASFDGTAIDNDVLLMTLDASGKVVGSQQWGSSDTNDIASAIAVDACGTAAIVGSQGTSSGVDGFLLIAR